MTERGLFVGRFQPFHLGHSFAIKYILEKVNNLIVLVGSAQFSYTWRNPFTAGERIEMIYRSLDKHDLEKVLIIPVDDTYERNYIWVRHVENYTPKFSVVFSNDFLTRRLFLDAGYSVLNVPFYNRKEVSGTRIRQLMAEEKEWKNLVPNGSREVIEEIGGEKRVRMIFQSRRIENFSY